MKIVILTHYYSPDSAGWIPQDIALELAQRGHEVRVLTSFPHYETGKVARGYRQRFYHLEELGPIRVRRVPIFPSHSSNPIGRIANYASFALTARTAKSFIVDADVIYVHGSPATVAAPARTWSKSLGIPFVFHVQDIWPESVTESGFLPKSFAALCAKWINRWLALIYSEAAAVNAIAPTARRMLIQRGVPESKCHLVFNWAQEYSPHEQLRVDCDSANAGLTVVYAGNLGVFQDLETVILAAHSLAGIPDFRLRIAGSGIMETQLRELVDDIGARDSIEFVGRLDRDQMTDFYNSADFQIVPLKDLDIFSGTIPSKFQGGLAHGVPVITTVKGDVTTLVKQHGLGFTALPEDVESLARAFIAAYSTSRVERSELSRRASAFYETNMSKSAAMDRIEVILQAAMETSNMNK